MGELILTFTGRDAPGITARISRALAQADARLSDVEQVVVQGLLYNADQETWLGIARLAMGYPLVGGALLGTVWAVRRARRAASPSTT